MPNRQIAPNSGQETVGQPDTAANDPRLAPRVLVVDDDPGLRLLMHETLAKAGFDVSEASSGDEALARCEEFLPDLVLLDINMPEMDGIAACAGMREQSDRDFPIIMVTSVDDADSIQRAFDAGATDFILKPVNWPLFQRRLDSVLSEWNRTQRFDASTKRVRLLEKVVPEQVMLVARNGVIIEDLKSRGTEGPDTDRTLDQLYGADIGQRMQQRISGVLKTGRHNNLEFTTAMQGAFRNFEAQFLIEGRERVIVVVQDVTGDDVEQSEIYDLAYFDSATALPNRHLFERTMDEVLTNARLQGRCPTFFCLCFDNISDQHLADREMMKAVSVRLNACLSRFGNVLKMGKPDDAVRAARTDTNRFMFVLQHDHNGSDTKLICDRVARELTGQLSVDGNTVTISPRLGIAQYPADGRDLGAVMHAAATAMNEALERGVGFCYQSQASARPRVDGQDYGNELRQALESGQLELFFQPRIAMPGGRVTSVEALLRWNHPIRGFVDLRELLYLAKASGLIVQLGDWVLREACNVACEWRLDPPPRVSINLSQQEFSRRDLADRVIGTLERAGLEPARIELELTEATLLRTRDELADLRKLKEAGVGLVLDDFGTGHSSLANLKQYPVDALKIDRSFVRGLPANSKDAAVCEVIVTMAHLFGMQAVAEGVETEAQLEQLLSLGCDEFQGFHVCKPLPASEIERYLVDLR